MGLWGVASPCGNRADLLHCRLYYADLTFAANNKHDGVDLKRSTNECLYILLAAIDSRGGTAAHLLEGIMSSTRSESLAVAGFKVVGVHYPNHICMSILLPHRPVFTLTKYSK